MHTIRHSASILLLAVTAALSGHALAAQPSSLTRDQVQAEFDQARARGELSEGEAGLRQNQLRPDLYQAQPAHGQPLTREQVIADMQRARDAGKLQYGETY